MEQITARQASASPPSVNKYNLLELFAVCLAYPIDRAVHTNPVHTKVALLNPNARWQMRSTCSMECDTNKTVTSPLYKVLNTGLALLLEEHVADGKHLIDDQDIGLGNGGD